MSCLTMNETSSTSTKTADTTLVGFVVQTWRSGSLNALLQYLLKDFVSCVILQRMAVPGEWQCLAPISPGTYFIEEALSSIAARATFAAGGGGG